MENTLKRSQIHEYQKYCVDFIKSHPVGEYKEDFLRSCRQIVDMLSDCSAFDKQIGNLQIRADELTAVMQAFIKDNMALHRSFNTMTPIQALWWSNTFFKA